MNKAKNLTLLIVGATLVSPICADQAKPPAKKAPTFDLSIRYVDSFAAVRESSEGQVVAKELETKRMELTKQIKELEQMFAAAAKELQAKASTLSESGREREQKKMVKMEREYKAKLQESDEDMKISMQNAQERLLREHNDAVQKYAKANDVDLIFGPGGVVFSSEKANCTMEVIKGMDKNFDIKLAKTKGQKKDLIAA